MRTVTAEVQFHGTVLITVLVEDGTTITAKGLRRLADMVTNNGFVVDFASPAPGIAYAEVDEWVVTDTCGVRIVSMEGS